MRNGAWIAGCILTVALGAAAVAGAGASPQAGSPALLVEGERVMVMRASDYWAGYQVVEGTGSALVRSIHNALDDLGLSPQPSAHAAVVNALEECRRSGCAYLVMPQLKHYTPKAMRARVRVSLELIDATSGLTVATCDEARKGWRPKGQRVQELMRPTVEACLDRLITVDSGPARAVGSAADEFLVVQSRELWLLRREGRPGGNDRLPDLVLDSLRRAGHRGERGPSGVEREKLFAHARRMHVNRILSVGIGLVWTNREEPPDDTPPQLIVSMVDVTSEDILQTVLVESTDRSWTQEGSELLPVLLELALEKLLGRSGHETRLPDGVTLSTLEPATIIQAFDVVLPRSARHGRLHGTGAVEVVIDERGEVVEARIAESLPGMDKAALRAAKRLRFLPARRDGEVCPMHMKVRYKVGD